MEYISKNSKAKSNVITLQPTFVNGVFTKMEEKQGGGVNESVEITYNSNGTVNTVLEIIRGDKTLYTFNYVNGDLSNITQEVV